ncbi:MAG TPA: MFS transporter [Candidatus Binatia bacterium]
MQQDNPPTNAEPGPQPETRRNALATLRHRDFRLLWLGQLVSTMGDQMQTVAIGWHIFILTDSSLQVGLVGLSRVIPFLLLSFIGGAMADRVSRKRLILCTQSVLMLTTVSLTAATVTGLVTPGFIYIVSVISGAATAFDGPARQSILPNLVPRNEVSNALTLQSLLRNTAQILGPSVGGVVIGMFGLGWTYGVNVATFLGVITALLLMSVVPAPKGRASRGWDAVLGGFYFVRNEPLILLAILLDFCVTLLRSYRVLLPVFVRDVLVLGPEALGALHSAGAIGALGGAAVLGSIGDMRHKIALMIGAYAIQGVFLIGFGFSGTLPMAFLMLAGFGIGNVVSEVLRNTYVQLRTPDELRGRVTALGAMFTAGGPQLGQVNLGALASLYGPIPAAFLGGTGAVLVCVGFALLPPMRRGMKDERAGIGVL